MTPVFFRTAAEFRKWLAKNHDKASELWVGFHKKSSGTPSITYPEALDQALCFGWIDGVRKSLDDVRYTIRFTPRKQKSYWSAVNIGRFGELEARGMVAPVGREAFDRRDPDRGGRYSFENRPAELAPPYVKRFKSNKKAWAFHQSQPPGYRRMAAFWVMDAKKEETRLRRLAGLIEKSAKGVRI